jgi:hypothetical protein
MLRIIKAANELYDNGGIDSDAVFDPGTIFDLQILKSKVFMKKEPAIGQRWRYNRNECDIVLEIIANKYKFYDGTFEGKVIQKIEGWREVGSKIWDYKNTWHEHFTYLPNQDKV